VDTLLRDWVRMVTFYAFPKEHWIHLRTTNVVERTAADSIYTPIDRISGMLFAPHRPQSMALAFSTSAETHRV
jgi:hypothetical protein